MTRHCFNFNELIIVVIVVIVILVLLAGMFLPAIGAAREPARRIACSSNLKQLGTTMFMYAGDYNDVFPDQCTSNDVTTVLDAKAGGLNRLVLLNYLSDTAVYNCPTTTDSAANDGDTITTLKTERTCSYIYAPGLMNGASDKFGNSDSALVADMTGFMAKRPMPSSYGSSISTKIKRLFTSKSNFGNHDEYGNILFQGMHVKKYTGTNQEDWFLDNYGSSYDPATQKGSRESSWSLTGQYNY